MIQHPYPEQLRRIPAQDRVVLRPPEPEVSTTQPWQDDLLDRSELGRDLTEKIRNEKSITVSLHGGWGTGKTFFLKRWQQDMENQGKRVVYFNAWENDFADDPIATLTSILAEQLKGSKFHRLARAAAWAAKHCATQAASDLVKSQTGTSIPFLQFLQRNKATPDKFTERKQALVLQPHILAKVSETALVVAVAGPGLMAPPPSGPRQHRFVQRHWPPDQPVQQSAYLGNRQRYQGFIPLRFSPFLP